jgi:hypothetical protein
MSARVSKDFAFQAGLYYENKFLINTYNIRLYMEVTVEDISIQNIALDRIKHLFINGLDNCIFVHETNKTVIENYIKAGLRVCTLPEEPYDQIIALVLLKKINTITDSKLYVTQIKISSLISDDVEFYVTHDEHVDFWNRNVSWWNNSGPCITDWAKKLNKKDKIVELKKDTNDWIDLGLAWKQKDSSTDNEIVFLNLDK